MRAFILIALVACSASQRHTALSATTAGIEAANVALVAYNDRRQSAIVAACPVADGKPACEAKLAEYQAKRTKVLGQIIAALNAIRDAWRLDNDVSFASAMQLAGAVEAAVKEF